MSKRRTDSNWQALWDARTAALEQLYGKMEPKIGHAPVPFEFGPEAGAADTVYFRGRQPGVLAVTSELVGYEEQIANDLGNYELAICHRTDESWGPNVISRLAHYTLETPLNPGETMSIGSAVPDGSSIEAFLFQDFGRFKFNGRQAGVLLCIGITAGELAVCQARDTERVEKALRDEGVFPYTDLTRKSVVSPKK